MRRQRAPKTWPAPRPKGSGANLTNKGTELVPLTTHRDPVSFPIPHPRDTRKSNTSLHSKEQKETKCGSFNSSRTPDGRVWTEPAFTTEKPRNSECFSPSPFRHVHQRRQTVFLSERPRRFFQNHRPSRSQPHSLSMGSSPPRSSKLSICSCVKNAPKKVKWSYSRWRKPMKSEDFFANSSKYHENLDGEAVESRRPLRNNSIKKTVKPNEATTSITRFPPRNRKSNARCRLSAVRLNSK